MRKQSELTPREVAQQMRVSLGYVYHMLWAGTLQGQKVGKQWRIPAEAVEARLKQRSA